MTTMTSLICSRSSTSTDRRDRRGRRIGYNWWREFIWGEWRCAHDAWLLVMADVAIGYETEEREYRYNNPSPKFKDYLIEHAGQHAAPRRRAQLCYTVHKPGGPTVEAT